MTTIADKNKFQSVEFLFFDLDNTLWDHMSAENRALRDLATERGWPVEEFIVNYQELNLYYWRQLEEKKVDIPTMRRLRIQHPLERLGIRVSDEETTAISQQYLDFYLGESSVYPNADICRELAESRRLGIISNGFPWIQSSKMKYLGFEELFDPIICSEDAPAMKPHPAIFKHAEKLIGLAPDKIAIVGDDWHSDINGAMRAGWKTIWVQHDGSPYAGHKYEEVEFTHGEPDAKIHGLAELRDLLL